jgi:hypothetical protein
VVFVWHCGIRDDHRTLDMEESETWHQVARCHVTMEAPMRSTSGEGFRYRRPAFPFPGVTKLGSSSRVGDAMVGERRWDDGQVLRERDILLGGDDSAALKLVSEIRQRLVSELLKAFLFVRMNEKAAFGDRSYY